MESHEIFFINHRNISELDTLGKFASTSVIARRAVAQAPIWRHVCTERWPTAMSFIQDLQYMYRGVEGPYYSLFCRRSILPKPFTDLTDLIHSCTLASQYAESKKSFIPTKQPLGQGLGHRVYQSTEVLLIQVLQASMSLQKLARSSPQLMSSREYKLYEKDISWWLEHHTRAVLSAANNTVSKSELKSLVVRLPLGMVHGSIVNKLIRNV